MSDPSDKNSHNRPSHPHQGISTPPLPVAPSRSFITHGSNDYSLQRVPSNQNSGYAQPSDGYEGLQSGLINPAQGLLAVKKEIANSQAGSSHHQFDEGVAGPHHAVPPPIRYRSSKPLPNKDLTSIQSTGASKRTYANGIHNNAPSHQSSQPKLVPGLFIDGPKPKPKIARPQKFPSQARPNQQVLDTSNPTEGQLVEVARKVALKYFDEDEMSEGADSVLKIIGGTMIPHLAREVYDGAVGAAKTRYGSGEKVDVQGKDMAMYLEKNHYFRVGGETLIQGPIQPPPHALKLGLLTQKEQEAKILAAMKRKQERLAAQKEKKEKEDKKQAEWDEETDRAMRVQQAKDVAAAELREAVAGLLWAPGDEYILGVSTCSPANL